MEWRWQLSRRDMLAVVLGTAAFVVLSLLRIEATFRLHPPQALGLLLTLLMYLIPGAVVGLIAPRAPLRFGAILGVLTVAVVLAEIGLKPGLLPGADVSETALAFLLLGIIACSIGSGLAARLRRRANDL